MIMSQTISIVSPPALMLLDFSSGQHEVVREVIARRIIIAARFGERDPARLREAALAERMIA